MSREDTKTLPAFGGTQVRDDGTGPVLISHRLRLLVVEGPDRALEREIEGTRLAIGTSEHNDLALSDQTVSRRHCEIEVRGDRYVVRDLESTNGTQLNGTPIIEAFLSPGTRIKLGDTEMVFEPKKKWERVTEYAADHFGELYGKSRPMRDVFAMLTKVARTDLSTILVGETGTGKELAARALHEHGPRSGKAFVVVDCGAISQNLIESELFGHEKGAFTGADRQRQGAFEHADGGTIFLDEIGELPLELQPKLLRALERREVKRLGAARQVEVDVRVIAATHRDLPAMVRSGKFREDLYYRLAEVVVTLPPLRDRREDVPVIVARILSQHAESGGSTLSIDDEGLRELSGRTWPGNVRELRNVLRRAIALSPSEVIGRESLKSLSTAPVSSVSAPASTAGGAPLPDVGENLPIKEAREQWVAPMEKEYLMRLLRRCGGDLDRAATDAGIHRKSLERLLRQHGLKASDLRG